MPGGQFVLRRQSVDVFLAENEGGKAENMLRTVGASPALKLVTCLVALTIAQRPVSARQGSSVNL